jgi:alkyl hydroperoxide reductase subunit AhpF
LSYDSVFRGYASYIKGITVKACGENRLVQTLAGLGVQVERGGECKRPVVEVWKGDRKYMTYYGTIDADTTWAVLNFLVRVSNGLVHLKENELQYVKDLDSTISLFVDMGCVKCLELIDLLGQIAIFNPRVSLEVYDLKSNPDVADKEKVVEAPKIVYKGRKIDGNLPAIAVLKSLDKVNKGAV